MAIQRNHRHPMALQAEVRKRLFAEGKIDEYGNRIPKEGAKPAPPPPPPKPRPGMVTSGSMLERKSLTSSPRLIVLSPREKLEALPDSEIIEKVSVLGLNVEGADRESLINSLLEAGAEG